VFSALGDRGDRDDGSTGRESRRLTERARTAVAALA
jgi:hypothetical protein